MISLLLSLALAGGPDRVDAVVAAQEAQRPRVFVLTEADVDGLESERLARRIRDRIGNPAALMRPAGDLCRQQAGDASEGAASPGEAGLDFAWKGRFSAREFAGHYALELDGAERIVTEAVGVVVVEPGTHRVSLRREDGTGPDLVVQVAAGQVVDVLEQAEECVGAALQAGGPQPVLVEWFTAVASELPTAPLYLVDARRERAKPTLWQWDGGALVERRPS